MCAPPPSVEEAALTSTSQSTTTSTEATQGGSSAKQSSRGSFNEPSDKRTLVREPNIQTHTLTLTHTYIHITTCTRDADAGRSSSSRPVEVKLDRGSRCDRYGVRVVGGQLAGWLARRGIHIEFFFDVMKILAWWWGWWDDRLWLCYVSWFALF